MTPEPIGVGVGPEPPATDSKASTRVHALVFIQSAAIFAAAFAGFLRATSDADMEQHLEYAQRIHSFHDVTSPHFLFEFAVVALNAVGLPYRPGTALLLGLCYGGMALLIAREIERRGAVLSTARAFVLIPATLIASHLFLANLVPPSFYRGYFVPTAYHNPTQQLNKLFALWISVAYASWCLQADTVSRKHALTLGGLCVLSALAKPSFLVAFLPVAAAYGVRDVLGRRWRKVSALMGMTVLPMVLVLLWQARLSYGEGASTAVVLAPFAVFNARETMVKLPLSLAFPLVTLVAAWRAHVWTPTFRFMWAFTAVALCMTLLIAEGGDRLKSGNFAWTGQTGVFLAYVESVLFLACAGVDTAWTRTAWAVFTVHVASGLVWYGLVFSPNWHHYV